MFLGTVVLIIGVIFLLENLGYLSETWSLIWPILLIIIGLWMIIQKLRRKE